MNQLLQYQYSLPQSNPNQLLVTEMAIHCIVKVINHLISSIN